jgi:hypothetical protein
MVGHDEPTAGGAVGRAAIPTLTLSVRPEPEQL